jgi:hypothetical protein
MPKTQCGILGGARQGGPALERSLHCLLLNTNTAVALSRSHAPAWE